MIARSTFFAIALAALGCARDPETASRSRVPDEWITATSLAVPSPLPSPDAAAATAIRQVMAFDAQALERATPSAEPRTVPWHVEGMISSFAISAKGVFGLFLGSGTTGVKVVWRRNSGDDSRPHPLLLAPSPARSVQVTSATSDATLDSELEQAARAAESSGSVRDPRGLRETLRRHGRSFLATARALARTPLGVGWRVQQYRLELGIDGAGKVAPVSVGGAANLRLDWEPAANAVAPPPASRPANFPEPAVTRFLRATALQLAALSDQALQLKGTGFELSSVRVGIGISAGGELAVARVQGAATGSITFERDAGATTPVVDSVHGGTELPLIGESGSPNRRALVSIPPRIYLAGYRRSLGIASFFAHIADRAASRRWHIDEIETEFDVSAGGEISLARVDGTAVVAISFKHKESR